jgi:hypothetical protein
MPIDLIDPNTPASTATAQVKPPVKSLNDPTFSALVQQDLKTGLKGGPKLSDSKNDGFKSTKAPDRFIPLNRSGSVSPPLSASSVEALGATTKHPLGPQKR